MRGYNGGAWNGSGIVSSTAAGDAAHAVGYALASEVLGSGGGTFLGRQVDGTAVVARYTLAGDTNPDGRVDFVDLVALAQNYNTTNGSATWHGGDLTYDGNVDFTDLVKLAQNYNSVLPSGASAAAFPAGFAADWNAALELASVPEPAAATLLLVVLLPLAGRRNDSRTSSRWRSLSLKSVLRSCHTVTVAGGHGGGDRAISCGA